MKKTLIVVDMQNDFIDMELVKLGYTNVKEFGGIIDWPYEIVK